MNGRLGRVDLLACILLGALIGACYAPELLGFKSFFFFDVSSLNLPARDWAFRQIRAGYFPEWCTHWYLGFPFIAESQSGVYYPPNYFFFLLFPSWYATTLAYTSHLWLAGIGAYFFFRRSTMPTGAWLGAASFALGGRLLEHQIHAAVVETIAWMPLILLGVMNFVEKGARRALWWTVIAVGFQAVAGSLQMVVLCHFALWTYVVSYCGLNRTAIGRAFLGLSVVGIASVLLSAALLIPTFELFRQSHRSGGAVTEWANFGAVSPMRWIGIIFPGALGTPAYSTAWLDDREPVFETGLYHGGVVLFLAFAGLAAFGVDNRRRTAFAATMLVMIGLSLAAGEMHILASGLRRLPIFSGIRIPARYLLFAGFGMCQLAALGWDRLLENDPRARSWFRRSLWVIGIATAASLWWMYGGLLSAYPSHADPKKFTEFLSRLLHGMLVIDGPRFAVTVLAVCCLAFARPRPVLRGVILLCLVIDLGWTVQFKYPSIDPSFHAEPASVKAVRKFCLPDPPRTYVRWMPNAQRRIDLRRDGWRLSMEAYRQFGECLYYERGPMFDVGLFPDVGELPLQPARLDEIRKVVMPVDRFLRLLGVPIAMSPVVVHSNRLIYKAQGCFLERVENAVPYSFFSDAVQRVPAAEVLNRLADESFDPGRQILLEGDANVSTSGNQSIRADVRWVGPNRIEVDVDAPSKGMLLIHEMFDAGWKAEVDGSPAPVERADYIFMAVGVEAERHHVVFSYAPASVRWGRWISGVSLVIWLLVGFRRMPSRSEIPLDRPPPSVWLIIAAFIGLFAISAVLLHSRWSQAFPRIIDPPAAVDSTQP